MTLPGSHIPGSWHMMPTSIPVGAIIAFAGKISKPSADPGTQPEYTTVVESQGWMVCDGRPLIMAEYGPLYAAIGEQYNNGSQGTDEFCIPDYRGYFLRMADMGSNNDPDANDRILPDRTNSDEVGSVQQDALQEHQHKVANPNTFFLTTVNPKGSAVIAKATEILSGEPTNALIKTQNTVKTRKKETRPKNVYVYYLIRFRPWLFY